MSANVLFLCTGNSARSILAEVILNSLDDDRFRGHSAGSAPVGQVNPAALEILSSKGHDTAGLRSKSWDEFSGDDAIPVEIVVTVCDNAAGESCPVWNGSPAQEHWGLPDPAAVENEDQRKAAFAQTYIDLTERIEALVRKYDNG